MKRVLIVIICLVLLVGCGKKEKEEGISGMLTIDINPSIEMEIRDNNAIRINPLDSEAEEIVDRDSMESKPLGEVLEVIIAKVKEKGYAENNEMIIILGMEEKNVKVEELLKAACEKAKIKANIIVPEITEEAKHEAEGYDVTPAKAAVILEAMKVSDEIHFDDLKDKSARELVQIKDTGKYCDREYTLNSEGKCEKRVRDEDPKEGKSCPSGYQEVKDKCYKVEESDLEAYCKSGSLKRNKCITYKKVDQKAECKAGIFNSKTNKCEELTPGGEGTKKCSGDRPKISQKGTCTYPKPTINGGCSSPDQLIDGWCYNMIDGGDQYPILTCPSGQTARDGKCYIVKNSDPTYSCGEGKKDGNKCTEEVENDPDYRVTCSEGFTNYQDKVCLDYNNSRDYVVELSCEKDARLEGKRCVYYEVIDAKSK